MSMNEVKQSTATVHIFTGSRCGVCKDMLKHNANIMIAAEGYSVEHHQDVNVWKSQSIYYVPYILIEIAGRTEPFEYNGSRTKESLQAKVAELSKLYT